MKNEVLEKHLYYQRRVRGISDRVSKVIVGQDSAITRGIVGALSVFQPNVGGFPANGHSTFIGFPGTGKSTFASVLAKAIGGTFSRIQCTADLLPRDFTGSFVEKEEKIVFQRGPLFANVVLCDEYNRAPEKSRSGVLQAKIEGFVSVTFGEERTFHLPRPNIIFMTLNPLEIGGLYQIGDADRDRSLFHIFFAPLSKRERLLLLERAEEFLELEIEGLSKEPVLSPVEFEEIRFFIWENVVVSRAAKAYMVRITDLEFLEKTLRPVREYLERLSGTGIPRLFVGYLAERPALGLLGASKVIAFLRGSGNHEGARLWVEPQDIREIYTDILNHRLGLSDELWAVAPQVAPRLLEEKLGSASHKFQGLGQILPKEIVTQYLLQEIVARVPDVDSPDA